MAIQQGYYTPAELNKIMYAPMEEQFGTYWKREVSQESQLWYEMIYCWQFACFRKKLRKWESNPMNHLQEIHVTYKKANILTRVRYFYKKSLVVGKRLHMKMLEKIHKWD